MPSFSARLRAAMFAAGMTNGRELAKRMAGGVTEQMIRRWLKQPEFTGTAKNLMNLANTLNVRAHWLFTGIGPPHRFHSEEYSERELLRLYRQLPARRQRMVMDLITIVGSYVKAEPVHTGTADRRADQP